MCMKDVCNDLKLPPAPRGGRPPVGGAFIAFLCSKRWFLLPSWSIYVYAHTYVVITMHIVHVHSTTNTFKTTVYISVFKFFFLHYIPHTFLFYFILLSMQYFWHEVDDSCVFETRKFKDAPSTAAEEEEEETSLSRDFILLLWDFWHLQTKNLKRGRRCDVLLLKAWPTWTCWLQIQQSGLKSQF